MLLTGVILLHENARPNKVAPTRALINYFGWEEFDNAPDSPDFVPSDYHLILLMKAVLGRQRFKSDEEIVTVIKHWLSSQEVEF